MTRFTAVIIVLCVCCATNATEVDFVRDVRPILQARCYSCHSATKQKSGLRLDVKSEAMRGGDNWGPSVVAGDSDSSPLIELVASRDEDIRMPPEGPPLAKEQIKVLREWIDTGAVWPDGVDLAKIEDKRDHWSFRPLSATNGYDSIDQFIDDELTAVGLQRNPPADARTLFRRIYFDLTGLPPNPDAVDAFIQTPNVDQLIDQLLESPQYGERWAQHWLDVIRWAETVGFETNAERRHAWHYRDWVIQSLNNDKPYDQFLFEQIAGDTVSEDAALGFLVAGPANLPGQIGRDEAAMRGARQDELDEVIRTVSQSFFGLTIGCARCHDHKFDPILQRDYYSMQAIFAGMKYGTRRLRGSQNDAWAEQLPAAQDAVDSLRTELESLRLRNKLRDSLTDVHTEEFAPFMADAIRMRIDATSTGAAASLYEFEVYATMDGDLKNVALASGGATISASSFALANQSRHFDNLIDGTVDQRQAYPWVAGKTGPAWFEIEFPHPSSIHQLRFHRGASMPVDFVVEVRPIGSKQWQEIMHTRDRMLRADDVREAKAISIASMEMAEKKKLVGLLGKLRNAGAQLARLANGPQVYAASFDPQPAATYVLNRGDAMQRGEPVAPAVPRFLGDVNLSDDAGEVDRRIALARHLTRADHPLTARVIVNRVWQHHFGVGLVDTPSDFGRMGTAPSHPELLDWLARRFIADGWSLKKLHRLIMSSDTYRQSSLPRKECLVMDAESRLLWRFPPRRLEAEAIRDSILRVSGKLDLRAGGPGFDLFNQRGGLSDYVSKETFGEEGWRRMIYAHKVRMISPDVFGSFDCPDAGQMKPRRTRSTTPIQALGLLNSPFVVRQSRFFADRIRADVGSDHEKQVTRAFEIAYSRQPTMIEKRRLHSFVTEHGLEEVCRAIYNTSEFSFIQ